jgi:hypothetical protein
MSWWTDFEQQRRLDQIREVRAMRDEMLTCDNLGRMKHLLMEMPEVRGYEITDYEIRKGVVLKLKGGFEYGFSGYGDLTHGFKAMAEKAYECWLDKILLNGY